ncbi:MAG: YcxB family protein [Lachnospiraceae bacterium]|nr:YcxB family protein [Lachnospiraceae bacterium]
MEEITTESTEECKQEVVLNPEDVIYEVDVHMTASVLYDYMLRHTYMSLTGPIATLLGAMCIWFFSKGASVIYLFAGIVIILYLPWNLFLNAKRQALTNEAFKKPLHYSFTAEGIYVSQDGRTEMQRWENMHKAVSTGKSVIVYTSKVNASIFPRKDLGNDVPALLQILCRYMDPKKVKFKQ